MSSFESRSFPPRGEYKRTIRTSAIGDVVVVRDEREEQKGLKHVQTTTFQRVPGTIIPGSPDAACQVQNDLLMMRWEATTEQHYERVVTDEEMKRIMNNTKIISAHEFSGPIRTTYIIPHPIAHLPNQ